MSNERGISVEVVLGVSVVFAGLAYPVTGTALDLTSPALIAVARALMGGLIMLPVLRVVGGALPRDIRGWAWATVIGVCNITITLIAISEGTRLAGAAVASVLLNSAPFFAALLTRLSFTEGFVEKSAGRVVLKLHPGALDVLIDRLLVGNAPSYTAPENSHNQELCQRPVH